MERHFSPVQLQLRTVRSEVQKEGCEQKEAREGGRRGVPKAEKKAELWKRIDGA